MGAEYLKELKCAVWDWGDRFRNPQKHLEEVVKHFLPQESCPAVIREGIENVLQQLRVPLPPEFIATRPAKMQRRG